MILSVALRELVPEVEAEVAGEVAEVADFEDIEDSEDVEDVGDVEVTLVACGRPHAHRLVGEQHRQALFVGGGVHHDRLDAHFTRRPDDPQGDFAAVGDQDFLEHACLRQKVEESKGLEV